MKNSNKNNKKMKNLLITVSVFLILAGSYIFFQQQNSPAPDVTFKTITNKTIHLKEWQEKIVLITFWASNCPSCIKEIADFKRLYQEYHRQGLEIVAIAMSYDRPNYVVDASKHYQIPYDIVLDLKGDLASAFGDVSLTPTTFLINLKGEIVYQITGVFNLKAMRERIELMQKET